MSTGVESGDTPYQGMQSTLGSYSAQAQAMYEQASDDLTAAAAAHGFDRDPALMAQLQAIQDAAQALVGAAQGANSTLVANHSDGDEYHSGQDAHASAFRPA